MVLVMTAVGIDLPPVQSIEFAVGDLGKEGDSSSCYGQNEDEFARALLFMKKTFS